MIAFEFRKSVAEEFLHAITNNKPLPPIEWTINTCHALAGVLHYLLAVQGPVESDTAEYKNLSAEMKEVTDAVFRLDLRDATEFCARLTANIVLKDFDSRLEPVAGIMVERDGDSETPQVTVTPADQMLS